ncbi:hypothetical protein H4R27_002203 [Coemansia aciculifera]|nr:hypothetical protein H4R27_002203 [Coemansia aciculifera]
MAKTTHVGKPMVLFLEIDDDDCKASKGAKSEDGTNQDSSGDPRCGNGDMHELLLGMSCMGIYNKSGEYYVTANLAKHNTELEERNNELMKELEEANNLLEIERSNREEDDVDNLKLEFEEERNVRRRKEASLRTINIHLQRELLEVVRLSNENKKLKEQACQISLLQRELRANRRVLNAYEDKFGPYQPADFSRFSHNGPEKTESLWLAQEQLSQLEGKVATLETLSGGHRVHIANLQRALGDRKKEIGECQSRYGILY